MDKAVLLDVSAIMYRAFYGNMNFKTKNEPTGAVYGFVNTLLSIIEKLEPNYLIAAFDVKRTTLKRTKIYKEYKQQREAIPEDLLKQIPRIEEVIEYFGIKKIKKEGYEADDILGSLARDLSKKNIETYIVTGDKDLSQILDKNINIALLGKGDGGGFKILSTEEDVINQIGVKPKMIPDLFGLIGDKSDGIPGVRKIGSKKAIPILEKYNSLEEIYEHIEELINFPGIGKSIIINLKEDKEMAFLSRKLATIDFFDVDLKVNEIEYKINREKLFELFKKLEFKSLIKKMGLQMEKDSQGFQLGLFSPENEKEQLVNFNILEKQEILEKLEKQEEISVYFEERGFAFSIEKNDFYIELNDENKPYLEQLFRKDIFFNSYGFKKILNLGFNIKKMNMDTMIAYHLLTSQTREEIEVMIKNILDEEVQKFSEVFNKRKPVDIEIEEFGKYLVKRSRSIQKASKILESELKKNNLEVVLNEIEMPLIEVLSSMEIEGIKISIDYFKSFEKELDERIENLKKKIFELAEGEFNLNSPKQMGEVLFLNLNIPPVKKTKTGFSTDAEVLEKLKEQGYEIAKLILEYRGLSKLNTTYVSPLPKMVDSRDRLHTTFNQTGTATGRLSSSEPNLQNIPVRSEDGIKIRRGFIAKEGYKLLGIDYSQIELRVLAEISKDENLIIAYSKNEDLHNLTARKIFNLEKEEKIEREQRDVAKTVNFSVIYGKTPFGLSQELKITPSEATDYIKKYFDQYPKVRELEKKIVKFAEENGYVETYFKRKRIIDGINSKNRIIKNQAQRMAVNTVIQGSAAEVLKKVMIEIHKIIKNDDNIKMLLQVHDELIFEVRKEVAQEYKEKIEKVMKECVKFKNVQLEVNGALGDNWAETK